MAIVQALSTNMCRTRPLPALVIEPRLTVSPVDRSPGTRPRYPISWRGAFKSADVADLCGEGDGDNQIDPTQGLQRSDDRLERRQIADTMIAVPVPPLAEDFDLAVLYRTNNKARLCSLTSPDVDPRQCQYIRGHRNIDSQYLVWAASISRL
jgi:hypothetical protein